MCADGLLFRSTFCPGFGMLLRRTEARTGRASGPGKPSPGVLVARLFRACVLRAAFTFRPGFISSLS